MDIGSIFQAFLIGAPLTALVSGNVVAQYFVASILVFVVGESIIIVHIRAKSALFAFILKKETISLQSSASKICSSSLPLITLHLISGFFVSA